MPTEPASRRGDAELSVMSFGEHLEELRGRVLRTLLVVGVGLIVALFFQDQILSFISRPHRSAMASITQQRVAERWQRELTELATLLDELDPAIGVVEARRELRQSELMTQWQQLRVEVNPTRADLAPFLGFFDRYLLEAAPANSITARLRGNVDELTAALDASADDELPRTVRAELTTGREAIERINARLRGWRASAAARVNEPLPLRTAPIERRLTAAVSALDQRVDELEDIRQGRVEGTPLRLLKYTDSFFAHLKISLLVGLLFGLPWLAIEVWQFVAAGLYPPERRAVRPFLPTSLFLLGAGGLFGYTVLTPLGLTYLGGYGSPELLDTSFTLADYISLVVTLILGMALVFQLPLIMVFLTRAGMVQTAMFRRYRKVCIVCAVLIGAMLTPPDVVTQLLMAGPLVVLFELGIWVSDLLNRKRDDG
ncbi:MAG: twin-arginine translocase subunit TatC [Planctomycetota bacterium]